MITTVITGDMIRSRTVDNPGDWLDPFKELLQKWGDHPRQWEITRGDHFQVEVEEPSRVLRLALEIKALIKSRGHQALDVRMAIGIGEKQFSSQRISESNGEAFIHSGELFEELSKLKQHLAVRSPWPLWDEEINLLLKWTGITMDKWTRPSAEMVSLQLRGDSPMSQKMLSEYLELNQSSVSERLSRARWEEISETEQYFQKRIKQILLI